MNTEKQKHFLIHAAYYGVIAVGAYLCLYYLFPPLMPFIIGFLIAWLLHRPAKAIARKLRISPRLPALLLTICFYAVVVTLITLATIQLVASLRAFLPQLPSLFTDLLLPFIDRSLNNLEIWLQQFDPAIAASIDAAATELFASTEQAITNLSSSALKAISSFVTAVPSSLIKIILTVVATFFASLDFDRITGFVLNRLPDKTRSTLTQTVSTSIRSIRKVLFSYGLILLMSFAELSIGFTLMRIPYAFLIATLVALFDILPVLGAGGVLIPWALIAFLMKNIPLGIGMLLLYVTMLVVRNIVEPKLVGKQIGLHPLVTLAVMIVGLQFFGVLGLLGCPIALSLLLKLSQNGTITMLKRKQGDAAKTSSTP